MGAMHFLDIVRAGIRQYDRAKQKQESALIWHADLKECVYSKRVCGERVAANES
jgi:hypothetical protein